MSDESTEGLTDESTHATPKFVDLGSAIDSYGTAVVATVIELHGITVVDRYGRKGHREHGSVEAKEALDFCAEFYQSLREFDPSEDPMESGPSARDVVEGFRPHLFDFGWPIDKFPGLLASAKQERVDAIGAQAAQEEAEETAKRRSADKTKTECSDAAVLGAVLAVLRGDVKDKDNKPVTYKSEAELLRVLVDLRIVGKNNYQGLSESTIQRRFKHAKDFFPLNGEFKVG